MAFNIKDRVKDAAKQTNMTEATTGGGYTPPEAGHPLLRFVGYYELGQHKEEFGEFKGKINTKVQLVFELHGPKYPPVEVDGVKTPIRMKMDLNLSLNEKAALFKLFKVMNAAYGNKFTHIAELLGEGFKGTVEHKVKKKGEKSVTYANLVNIRKAEIEDEETGTMKPQIVPPALSEIKGFLWDQADMEMWNDIFIPGEYPERKNDKDEVTAPARSKNVIQQQIMKAINFKGLPIYGLIKANMTEADEAALSASVADLDNADDREAVSDPSGDDLADIA